MLTCPHCGHKMPEGNQFCEECGTKLVAPIAPPQKTTEPKPSWITQHKKKIIALCIALAILGGGAIGGKVYIEYHYVTQTVSISGRLATTNKSLIDNVQQLSKATTAEDRDKAIAAIKENQTDMTSIIQDHTSRFVPGKFNQDADAISSLLREEETIYADVIFIIDNPTDTESSQKLDDVKEVVKKIKDTETTIHIPGADFTLSRDMDNLTGYLNIYKKSVAKDERDKSNIANRNGAPPKGGNSNLATPDGAFRKYHQYLSSHNLQQAYAMFTQKFKSEVPYEGWAGGYASTLTSEPTMIQVTANDGKTATMNFTLKARDRMEDGSVYVTIYDGTCTMQKNDGQWQIYSVSSSVVNDYKE